MRIPEFNAEKSVYHTRLYYRTAGNSNQAKKSEKVYIGQLMRNDTINIFGCSPGMIQFGSGENITCIDPNTFWNGHGSNGGVAPDDWSDPPGPGGGLTSPHPPPKKPCTACAKEMLGDVKELCKDLYEPHEIEDCHACVDLQKMDCMLCMNNCEKLKLPGVSQTAAACKTIAKEAKKKYCPKK